MVDFFELPKPLGEILCEFVKALEKENNIPIKNRTNFLIRTCQADKGFVNNVFLAGWWAHQKYGDLVTTVFKLPTPETPPTKKKEEE